ncbi:MAG: hypothetical protein AMXMBFR64_36570 [Myxococcales bacterium]
MSGARLAALHPRWQPGETLDDLKCRLVATREAWEPLATQAGALSHFQPSMAAPVGVAEQCTAH